MGRRIREIQIRNIISGTKNLEETTIKCAKILIKEGISKRKLANQENID